LNDGYLNTALLCEYKKPDVEGFAFLFSDRSSLLKFNKSLEFELAAIMPRRNELQGEATMNRRQLLTSMAAILAGAATASAQRRQADAGALLDLNAAPAEKLMTLPGVDLITAKKIIAGRPYKAKNDLVTKKVIPQETFNSIQAGK
jgi:competence protein ComEA